MRVKLSERLADKPAATEAAAIIENCVHCGFCTATCPSYQVLDNELDSPRGRIYLIKQMLEGAQAAAPTRDHLDLCLTCRSCESTCPTGVQYGRLVDIGRAMANEQAPRTAGSRLYRSLVRRTLLARPVFAGALRSGRALRPLLPKAVARRIPLAQVAGAWPAPRHARKAIALDGCVQPALAPQIDAALARVLDRAGISLIHVALSGCCGAVSQHLDAPQDALQRARRNIDAWWPHVESGAEAIVATSSGCGSMLKEYGHLLRDDPAYADKAARVSELVQDSAQLVARHWGELRPQLLPVQADTAIAFQSPCSLQHGLKVRGVAEKLLVEMGYTVKPVADAHLCCGSAGTYSLLHADVAAQLRTRKLAALEADAPRQILSANIGCIVHLQAATDTPVRHWIEVLDERLQQSGKQECP